MTDDALAKSNRLSILHPKIYINAIIMLIVGSFNSIGQKTLFDSKYGNFKHPIWTNIGMFYGEYLNYIFFMILCLIPKTFKGINEQAYKKVYIIIFFIIKRKQLKKKSSIHHSGEQDLEVFVIVLVQVFKLFLYFLYLLQFIVLVKMQLSFLLLFSVFFI